MSKGSLKGGQSSRKCLAGCQGQGPRTKKKWPPKNDVWQTIFFGEKRHFATFFQKGNGLLSRGLLQFLQFPENKNVWQKVADLPFFFYLFANWKTTVNHGWLSH